MKKITSFVIVGIFLIGLALVWNALEARALPSSGAGAVQPTNTPAVPQADIQSPLVCQLPSLLAVAGTPGQTPSGEPVAEQWGQDDAYIQRALQHVEALRQAGVRFQAINSGVRATGNASPQSPSTETCMDVLLNPEMDVVEFGDGTGSIEYWSILSQTIYYDNRDGYYNSAQYSLAMVDDSMWVDEHGDPFDTDLYSSTLDLDEFGQGFWAPDSMTAITVTYHRLYTNTDGVNDGDDIAFAGLIRLDEEGQLTSHGVYWFMDEDPSDSTWRGYYVDFDVDNDPSVIATLSGYPVGLLLWLESNRAAPYEFIWLDDVQVTVCYEPAPSPQEFYVYLPATLNDFGDQPPPPPLPTCTPYEPDSVSQRGSTTVGATCSGSFSQMDMRDYYSLNLSGVANVRLRLSDLPSGTNWDALIYEDASGYPLACQIGIPGDQDKYANCTLNPSKDYFVLVNTGTPPGAGANTYNMSVEQR
ncbi:MAG: hypothetical protein ACE5OS_09950 [Anaerolineae bacterium]